VTSSAATENGWIRASVAASALSPPRASSARRVPGHGDRGEAEEQAHDRREREDHDRVVQRHLREGEIGVAAAELAPHEHHRRAGRRGEQDEPGDVTVDLVGGQPRREDVADEDPAEQRHRERLHQPVDGERHADAARMRPDLPQRAEVDAQEHRDDHHPDEDPNGNVDPGDLHPSERFDRAREGLSERDARDDAKEHPKREPPLEEADGGTSGRCARRDGVAHRSGSRLRAFGPADRVEPLLQGGLV